MKREIFLTLFLSKLLLYIWSVSDAYAEYSKVPVERAVKVPDQLTMEQAASTLWQGFTAHAFACSSYPIKAGDKILVHAAAGGVGNLIIQIAKNAGTCRYHCHLNNKLNQFETFWDSFICAFAYKLAVFSADMQK